MPIRVAAIARACVSRGSTAIRGLARPVLSTGSMTQTRLPLLFALSMFAAVVGCDRSGMPPTKTPAIPEAPKTPEMPETPSVETPDAPETPAMPQASLPGKKLR